MDRGFIEGKKAPFCYGSHHVWNFQYEDIIQCIEKRPWLANLDRMEESYFRSIVLGEYRSNPWYTADQAAPLIGVADCNPVRRYIIKGWLRAEKRPGAGGHGEYVIRKKDIDAFLQNDPRPGNKSTWMKAIRNRALRREKQRRYRLRKKMATVDWRGRGTKVKNCPVGRTTCHEQCPAWKEARCCYRSRSGTELWWIRPG